MKLEVGKYYKTRDGRKAKWDGRLYSGFAEVNVDGEDEIRMYGLDGRHFNKAHLDLISEWTDTPEIGTLAEIGAQVGDVVSCHNAAHNGTEFEVTTGFEGWAAYDRPWWRIVSRAKPQGPVVTETVKRIVPGVYGRLRIDECASPKYISIELDDDVFAKDEIRAMIETMRQVADAMPQE